MLYMWKHAQCKHWTHFKKLLGKVLICQRTEQVIILVIALTGIECTSQSCSAFGIWVAVRSWVCMYCVIIKTLDCWVTFTTWNSSWFFLRHKKADTGNKRETRSIFAASLNVCPWSHCIHILYWCSQFSLLVFSLSEPRPYVMCCTHWACLLLTHLQ